MHTSTHICTHMNAHAQSSARAPLVHVCMHTDTPRRDLRGEGSGKEGVTPLTGPSPQCSRVSHLHGQLCSLHTASAPLPLLYHTSFLATALVICVFVNSLLSLLDWTSKGQQQHTPGAHITKVKLGSLWAQLAEAPLLDPAPLCPTQSTESGAAGG